MSKKNPKNDQKRSPGRPKLAVQRTKWLPVRVSDDEIEMVRRSADKAGCGVTEYVRNRLGLPGTGYGEGADAAS